MACTAVEVDTLTVVYGGWSPAELHALAPHADVIAAAQPPLSVPETTATRLRPSMMSAPFETLHRFWCPLPPSPRSPLTGASVLLSGGTTAVLMSWRRRGDGIAEQCRDGPWLRVVSTFPHRRYAVDRAPRHLLILLQALRLSFPHLMVPADQQAPVYVARGLVEFVEAHAAAVSKYLPLLYFLYEADDRCVIQFFDALDAAVRQRLSSSAGLLDALRPRAPSWFGWGAPRPRAAQGEGGAPADDERFAAALHRDMDLTGAAGAGPSSLEPSSVGPSSVGPSSVGPSSVGPSSVGPSSVGPSSVGPSSVGPSSLGPSSVGPSSVGPSSVGPSSVGPSSLGPSSVGPSSLRSSSVGPSSLRPSLGELVKAAAALTQCAAAAVALRDALVEEAEAFAAVAEWCGAAAREGPRDTARLREGLRDTIDAIAARARAQALGPEFAAFVDAARAAEGAAQAQCAYVKAALACARVVVENEAVVTGVAELPRSSQAARSQSLMRSVCEMYGRERINLRAFQKHFDEETSLADAAVRRALAAQCVHAYSALSAYYDAFEMRRHTPRAPTADSPAASDPLVDASAAADRDYMHPLLQLFQEEEEQKWPARTYIPQTEEKRQCQDAQVEEEVEEKEKEEEEEEESEGEVLGLQETTTPEVAEAGECDEEPSR